MPDNYMATSSDNNLSKKPTEGQQAKTLTYIALAFVIVGLIFCWYPIIGIAHALAGTILSVIAYKQSSRRISLYSIIIGIIATIASAVMTIIELNDIELLNTYNAAPWL